MNSLVFLVNPAAGNGAGREAWSKIEKTLRAAHVPYDVESTTTPQQATERAREWALSPVRAVVAVGGDSTVNGVLNGLIQATQAGGGYLPLGIVALGKTNDLANMLGLPIKKPITATRRIINGQPYRIDVGVVKSQDLPDRERYFANGFGLGLDAYLAAIWPPPRGIFALWRLLGKYRAPTVSVTLHSITRTEPISLLTVGNGRRHLGHLWLTPTAMLDDGLFNICLISKLPRHKMLAFLMRAMRGTHTEALDVRMEQTTSLSIESQHPLAIQLDGDLLEVRLSKAEIELLPARLAVML
jgi:YegS/Rv2252/BmrU family lipid kinase